MDRTDADEAEAGRPKWRGTCTSLRTAPATAMRCISRASRVILIRMQNVLTSQLLRNEPGFAVISMAFLSEKETTLVDITQQSSRLRSADLCAASAEPSKIPPRTTTTSDISSKQSCLTPKASEMIGSYAKASAQDLSPCH